MWPRVDKKDIIILYREMLEYKSQLFYPRIAQVLKHHLEHRKSSQKLKCEIHAVVLECQFCQNRKQEQPKGTIL